MNVTGLLLAACLAQSIDFDTEFTGTTLRFDYHHCGTAGQEQIAPDATIEEGPWAGRRRKFPGHAAKGKYAFVVLDQATHRPLYQDGFSSIYGEWETTREAKSQWRVFGESIRFPTPRRPVQLVIKKRGADGLLREIWSGKIDSTSRHIRRPKRSSRKVWTIHEGGANDRCVDLLFLGDGYTAGELDSFLADAKRLTKELFRLEPYRSLSHHFNVRAVHVASPQSGITHPRGGQWRSNPLGLSFNAFDLDRYVLTYRNRAIRDAASVAPYDTLVLLANTDRYGGGGIYNLWSTCVAKSSESPYLFLHEFGHSFAGLADEYYTSAVAYEDFTPPGSEPWEPNITALLDPSRVKWRDLLTDGVEIPTRWRQAEYDRLSLSLQKERGKLRAADADAETMKSYYERVRKATSSILIDDKNAKSVGAFEGAGYQAKGLFRPEIDCIMFSRNRDGFCKVCAQAIVHTIHDHIGGARP